ncbi:hypothetical protein AB6A40_003847 [Gnathostoma spinigerum]|uniref:Maturase K n=1 Tax=Gnathostoma spinigerum TaxID=75299 RepID=A0ABD6EAR3_9BILA
MKSAITKYDRKTLLEIMRKCSGRNSSLGVDFVNDLIDLGIFQGSLDNETIFQYRSFFELPRLQTKRRVVAIVREPVFAITIERVRRKLLMAASLRESADDSNCIYDEVVGTSCKPWLSYPSSTTDSSSTSDRFIRKFHGLNISCPHGVESKLDDLSYNHTVLALDRLAIRPENEDDSRNVLRYGIVNSRKRLAEFDRKQNLKRLRLKLHLLPNPWIKPLLESQS